MMFARRLKYRQSTRLIYTFAAVMIAMVWVFSAWSPYAFADGLYESPVPPGAAYVRFLNRTPKIELSASIDGRSVAFSGQVLTPYSVHLAGKHDVTAGSVNGKVQSMPGRFYTIIVGAAAGLHRIVAVEDEAISNPALAKLFFYNLSRQPASLLAQIGGKEAPVFSNITPGAHAAPEVRPFEVGLKVQLPSGPLTALPNAILQQQQAVSIVVVEVNGVAEASLTLNGVAR
ncbi:MAG: alginate O-acetyltransferase AlgF [Pseudomonadota bacterium]